MKLPPIQKKLVISLLIILLVLFLISIFVIYPSIRKINNIKINVEKLETELEDKYNNARKLRRTMKELEEIKQNVQKYQTITIKKGDELSLITTLENIAKKNNIEQNLDVSFFDYTVDSKNPKGEKPALDQYYEISFLNIGKYKDLLNYLGDLEELPQYLIIKNLTIEKKLKVEDTNTVTLNFQARVYVEKK